VLSLTEFKQKQLWTRYAVQFIFESNAIEGSKLSSKEVKTIVKKEYVKKNIEKNIIAIYKNYVKNLTIT